MKSASAINGFLGVFGLSITRVSRKNPLHCLIELLVRNDIQIGVVYDIGAYKGHFSAALQKILGKSSFYLFEANAAHEQELKKLGHPYFIQVLSDTEQNIEWFSNLSTGDSIYRENQIFYSSVPPITRPSKKLDTLISEFALELPDLIKLDVQGSELCILQGGRIAVSHCKIICMEIPIVEYNLGAPNITNYLKYMEEVGFVPVDLLEVHKASGVIVQVDIAFAKKEIWSKMYDLAGRDFLK